jgi:hypothetical protein
MLRREHEQAAGKLQTNAHKEGRETVAHTERTSINQKSVKEITSNDEPTEEPTEEPTKEPTQEPTEKPTKQPTAPPTKAKDKNTELKQAKAGAICWATKLFLQLLFGLCYYFFVAVKYPQLPKNARSTQYCKAFQDKNEVFALGDASSANLFHSFCCTGPRMAHTFSSLDTMGYWPGLCLGSLCPCFLLWGMTQFTDKDDRLGGEKRSCPTAFLCSFLCSCCVVSKDAGALDLMSGTQTTMCGTARLSLV